MIEKTRKLEIQPKIQEKTIEKVKVDPKLRKPSLPTIDTSNSSQRKIKPVYISTPKTANTLSTPKSALKTPKKAEIAPPVKPLSKPEPKLNPEPPKLKIEKPEKITKL